MREGPYVQRSCSGCKWLDGESYRCQGDSGVDYYCTHQSLATKQRNDRHVGDSRTVTPNWCPFLQPASAPETFSCLGGCGASVPSKDAYCSACFLRERHKAKETRPAPPCFWCGCEKDHPDHKFGAGKNHAYRVGPVVTKEEREAYALNR